ncbi:GNAT family N-acetyltransferase [Streptomyces niveus]|uniref:GNAT family N-acetyltransferase n=1 Tax=Streptomyces niveus TaxID=193462 RepID=UPI003711CFF8
MRPVDPFSDAELLHGWITHPKTAYWLMQDASLPDIEREYMAVATSEHRAAYVGLHEGRPAFPIERYDPARVAESGLAPRRHAVQPDRALREAPEALGDGRAPVLMHGPSRAPASSSTKPTASRYSAGHGTTGER